MTVRALRQIPRQPPSGIVLASARGLTRDESHGRWRRAAEALAVLLPPWRLAEIAENCRLGRGLTYCHCDDWLICAHDAEGKLYALSTEMWPEWEDFPEGSDQERGAVERYMLPVARAKWDGLMFRRIE